MANRLDLLVSSFQETVRLLQTYMVSGLGASFFFVVLAFSSVKEVTIQAPALGSSLPVSTSLALTVAIAVYWAAGVMCTLLVDRARRLSDVILKADEQIHDAVLSMPSVVLLRSSGPRLGLAMCPAALALVGAVSVWGRQLISVWPAFGLFVLVLPFVMLAFQLRSPIGGNRADQWLG